MELLLIMLPFRDFHIFSFLFLSLFLFVRMTLTFGLSFKFIQHLFQSDPKRFFVCASLKIDMHQTFFCSYPQIQLNSFVISYITRFSLLLFDALEIYPLILLICEKKRGKSLTILFLCQPLCDDDGRVIKNKRNML